MKFLIQSNSINKEQLKQIQEAVKDIPHEFVTVLPFDNKITPDVNGIDWIPYGSSSLANISKELGFTGLNFDLDVLNYETFCRNRDDMLNDGYINSIDMAVKHMNTYTNDELLFTRPSEDTKQFPGYVDKISNITKHFEDMVNCSSEGSYAMSKDDIVILSNPKEILMEWRYFIIGGKIVDGSIYRKSGELFKEHEDDENVLEEAQQLADKWLPSDCCVMDLGLIETEQGRELKVIEFNNINSSGFYNHDIPKIFKEWYDFKKK